MLCSSAQTLASSQVTASADPCLASPNMFMWQPSYSEVPKVCLKATPLLAGTSKPSRQGTTTMPFSSAVTARASSSRRMSGKSFPS